jgi:hypothetical protein
MAVGGASGGGGGSGGSIRAGKAHVEFSAKDAGLEGYLDRMGARVTKFGGVVAGVGGTMLALGGAVLGPLAGLFKEVVGHFDNVNDAADRLGTTTESISRLGYAASLAGSSMEEVEAAAGKMQRALADSPETFDRLGLSADELKGMGLEDQFAAISDALSGIEDPAERSAAAMAVFGKSGRNLLPLLKDGSGALRKAFERSDLTGTTVNSQDARDAAKTADALDEAWAAVKGTLRAVGAAFLPLASQIESGTEMFLQIAKSVREFINENREAIQTVAAVAAGVMVAGAALVGIGGAIAVAGMAISGLMAALAAVGSVLAVVFSPVGLGIAAVIAATVALAALAAELLTTTETGMAMLDAFDSIWGGILDTFNKTYGGIVDAIKAGDLSLAWDVLVAGLDVAWKGFLVGVQAAWTAFKDLFVDGWHDIVTEIKVAAAEAAAAVKEATGSDFLTGVAAGLLGGQEGAEAVALGKSPADIRADAERDKAERQKVRDKEMEAAVTDLEAAKKKLGLLAETAAAARAEVEYRRMIDDWVSEMLAADGGPAKGMEMAALASSSRGSFSGGANAWQELGAGGSVLSKIEANTKRGADAAEKFQAAQFEE